MNVSTLLADPNAVELVSFISNPNSITIVIRTNQSAGSCPLCHHLSRSRHSSYVRKVADLPWHGVAISLLLHTRKFRCRNELCIRKVFCERLPKVVRVYARKTVRCNDALTWLAFALGGEAGARTAGRLNLTASGDTLLRRIRQRSLKTSDQSESPRVLGVDDFAFRRGHRYGTILVDLEKRKPIDLLPDREAETLKVWLAAHPGIEIVSRDRSGAYADGVRRGAPQAKQVADRWHLLKNATEVLEKTIDRNRRSLKRSLFETEAVVPPEAPSEITPAVPDQTRPPCPLSPYHEERKELYDLVKTMQRQGLTINQIRLQLNRHHTTIARFYRAAEYPLTTRPRGSRLIRPFQEYLRARWAEGCHNAKELFLELSEQGYRGSALTVRRATTDWREPCQHAK
ncbi:MAG: ISL3 family transposase [Acidobacteria bacterium]|nr:ISL3 family transposase [Acidobacteriota bacterium]